MSFIIQTHESNYAPLAYKQLLTIQTITRHQVFHALIQNRLHTLNYYLVLNLVCVNIVIIR
jgi:hypothetical protein